MALDPAQQKRLHGVTMFMAELFMNMEVRLVWHWTLRMQKTTTISCCEHKPFMGEGHY